MASESEQSSPVNQGIRTFGAGLSLDTDDDGNAETGEEEDELLHYQPFTTTFEKSFASSKRARTGAFGSRSTKPMVFGGKSKVPTLNSNDGSLLQQENQKNIPLTLPTELKFTEGFNDDIEVFSEGGSTNLPVDLFPTRTPHPLLRKPSKLHQRSASTNVAVPSRSPLRSVRSNNSNPPPRAKASRRLQRAHSLALGIQDPMTTMSSNVWGESMNPDRMDSILDPMMPPQLPERTRGLSRRHSLSISTTNMTDSTRTRSTVWSDSLSSSNLWKEDLLLELDEFHCYEPTLFSQSVAMSPADEERSVLSTSRKRGASSSSVSDLDEYITHSGSSLSGKRRSCSQSRIFAPPVGQTLPMAPSLSCDGDYFGFHPKKGGSQHGQSSGRGADFVCMEQDSEDEQSDDEMSLLDSSHEETGTLPMDSKPISILVSDWDDINAKVKHILETMPSVEDLKFVLSKLEDEDRRCRRISLSTANKLTWKVALPLNQWSSHRRTRFIDWARATLSCTVLSGGAGYLFVQIGKTRGARLLEALTLAMNVCLDMDPSESSMNEGTPPLFSLGVTRHSVSAPELGASRKNPGSVPFVPIDLEADELADKISSLSMMEAKVSVNGGTSNSLIRTVTLPASEENEGYKYIIPGRLSVENDALDAKTSRPSFDSHSCELTRHLYGHSPHGRPPKSSIAALPCDGAQSHSGTRNSRTPCANNLCFVTTPLMSQDRGWGCRPVAGKDWGSSLLCDTSVQHELMARLEHALNMEASDSSMIPCTTPYHSLSQQDFDLEADYDELQSCLDVESKATDRRHRKMICDLNKKKRVSLFASSFNTKLLPSRQSYYPFQAFEKELAEEEEESCAVEIAFTTEKVILNVLSYLTEVELMTTTFAVNRAWAEFSTLAHVNLLVASTGTECELVDFGGTNHLSGSKPTLERSWEFLRARFPWACFLAAGGAKKVFKVYNASVEHEEALSVMDTHNIDNMEMVANELAISSMVSSFVRRGVCPNFIAMHGVFTCAFSPPESAWGHEDDKRPNGERYVGNNVTSLSLPPSRSEPGRYQYIRMELVNEGDAEELLKRQRDELFPATVARSMIFQLSFSLYTAAEKISMKHYDIKLLNVFVQNTHSTGDVVLRYGFGAHVFALCMPPNHSYIVKLADFGTSNVSPASGGLPITIAHFTTLENTPPDFLLLGDAAKQGHGHDHFALGLAMLHLFTGSRPYEEILEDVTCPSNFKKRLRVIWENEKVNSYSIIRTLIMDGVDVDEYGNVEGDRDETLYDTLYRYLVLFGIPDSTFEEKAARRVWDAIFDSLSPTTRRTTSAIRPLGKSSKTNASNDVTTYRRDCKKYSIRSGNNKYISRARRALRSLPGGLELLLSLCDFDPQKRASAKDVLNSEFMAELRENRFEGDAEVDYGASSTVYSYMSFATTTTR